MSTTDLIGAMFGGELELALLQVDAPNVARFIYHAVLVHAVVSVSPVHVLCLRDKKQSINLKLHRKHSSNINRSIYRFTDSISAKLVVSSISKKCSFAFRVNLALS